MMATGRRTAFDATIQRRRPQPVLQSLRADLQGLQGGFTLVELLVVLAIIGIVSAMSYGLARESITRQRVRNARVALERAYKEARHRAFALGRSVAVQVFPDRVEVFSWNDANGNGLVDWSDMDGDGTYRNASGMPEGEVVASFATYQIARVAENEPVVYQQNPPPTAPAIPGGCGDYGGTLAQVVIFYGTGFMVQGDDFDPTLCRWYVVHTQRPELWARIDVWPNGHVRSQDGF